MKLKYEFTIMEMDGETLAIPVGEGSENFHGVIRLNESSAEVFELLKEETTPEKVHQTLMERYTDSTKDEIGQMLAEFFNTLIREGVLQAP